MGFETGCACQALNGGGLCGGGANIGANPVLLLDILGPAGGELKKLVACSRDVLDAG